MYEPQCINIKACKFIKYLQLFIIKYINKVDIIIKPKLLIFNNYIYYLFIIYLLFINYLLYLLFVIIYYLLFIIYLFKNIL